MPVPLDKLKIKQADPLLYAGTNDGTMYPAENKGGTYPLQDHTMIDFGAVGEREVFQNVKYALLTTVYSVPLDREFGIDATFVDKPIPIAQIVLSQEVALKIGLYEPRARFRDVSFEGDGLEGKLEPTIEIEIDLSSYLAPGALGAGVGVSSQPTQRSKPASVIIYQEDDEGALVPWIRGPQGEPGMAATIEVGETTTGEVGDPAEVTNVGNDQHAIFDFVIPAGSPGPPGASNAISSANWIWRTNTNPPNIGEFKTNFGVWGETVVELNLSKTDTDARPLDAALLAIKVGDQIRIQNTIPPNALDTYTVIALPIDQGSYVNIGVEWSNGSSNTGNDGDPCILSILTSGLPASEWHTGQDDPTIAIGKPQDMYLQDNGDVWEFKSDVGWVNTGTNIEGPRGFSATLEAGTTTTGEAGTDALVTNSGTRFDATFDFIIPRGDKGDKGDKGDVGAQGYDSSYVGTIMLWPNVEAPNGWLNCDGRELDIDEYRELFDVIGVTYGNGNGLSTFNIPDYRGRIGLGYGLGVGLTNRVLGVMGGEEAHILSIAEIPAHTHANTLSDPTHAHTVYDLSLIHI